MTLHDWKHHITAKGIGQNEAVRMLNEAQEAVQEYREALDSLAGEVQDAAQRALRAEAENERLRAALLQVVGCPLCNGDGAYPPVYESPFGNVCEYRKEARRVLGEEGER